MADETSSERSADASTSENEGAKEPDPRATIIGDLLYRRVPQVLTGYLGVTWTLFEFLQWLTNQYLISPYLGRIVLFGLLTLIPSVLLVTYRHGRPGPDEWTATERYSVVGNVLVTALGLFFVYGGVELGSMTKAVQASSASDSSAATVRQVPKKEFRKRVALFYFDQPPKSTADTALRRTVPTALRLDLRQDDFVGVQFIANYAEILRDRNYREGFNVPLGLKREIAQEENAPYILAGTVGRARDTLRVTTRLYETKTGGQIARHTFAGERLFPIVDRATKRLKADLQLPRTHRENAPDLPVTQVFTGSLAAAKHYAQGVYYGEGREARDRTALTHFRKAGEADSTFALAHMKTAAYHWRFGRRADARAAYRQAQRHDYRLSRSDEYRLRVSVLYWIDQRPEAALQICERWTTLNPYDLGGWQWKARLHRRTLQHEAELKSYRQALNLSPDNRAVQFQIGRLLLQTGRSEQAVEHFSDLAEKYPEAAETYFFLGYARWLRGRHDAAEEAFRTAQRIDADARPTAFANLLQATGRFDQALRTLLDATRRTDAGRKDGYQLWHHYWLRGRIEKSKAVLDSLQAAEVSRPSFHQIYLAHRSCHYYTRAGAPALIRDALSTMQNLAERYRGTIPDYEVIAHVALTSCNLAAGNLERAGRHVAAADSIVRETGRQSLRLQYRTDYYRGRLHEAQGDYERAAQSYERLLDSLGWEKLVWTERLPQVQLALAYQRSGAPEKARATYRKAIDLYPAHPRLNYHYARFLLKQDEPTEAHSRLQRTLKGWAPADSTFAPKQRAQALVDSLRSDAV